MLLLYTLGFLFNLKSKSQMCKDIQKIRVNQKTPNKIEKYFPYFPDFINSKNSRYQDLFDKERCNFYYSGEKKRHAIKNQIMINNLDHILHKITYKKGKRYDYDITKRIILSFQNELLFS